MRAVRGGSDREEAPQTVAALEALVCRLLAPLGWAPEEPSLYLTAFTHASYRSHQAGAGAADNERLEFLGDAVLELVVSHHLFAAAGEAGEGSLTRMRSAVVRTRTLAGAAERLQLAPHLRLSRGEARSGGRARPAMLADLFEALVGALMVDLGYEAAAAFVRHYLGAELSAVLEAGERRDFKSRLQEWVQQRHRTDEPPLSYRVLAEEGPDHAKRFTVEVRLFDEPVAQGHGHSKQDAELAAAETALLRLAGATPGEEPPEQG